MSTGTALITESAPKQVASLAGGMVSAIVPQTFDDVYRFAQVVAQSGLAPYGMDTPQKITVSILTGLEIGVKPMQAIQGIAVIGNRPCVWGDLALGLVRGAGTLEYISETFEGDEAACDWSTAAPTGEMLKFKAICRVKRKGEPEVVNEFSVNDAVIAQLWGKKGYNGKPTPWITNPKRMLKMRARGFGLRDTHADVLKGLYLAEELIGTEVDREQQVAISGPSAPPPAAAVSGPAAPPAPAIDASAGSPGRAQDQRGATPDMMEAEARVRPATHGEGKAGSDFKDNGRDHPVVDAEVVEPAAPAPEKAGEQQHPEYAQEEPFDVEAWLEEVRGHFASAKTISDVDDVHATFEDTATDLPAIEAQRYEDMHGAAIKRIEDALKAEIERDVLGKVAPRYFIHPESGSYWHTTDGSDPRSEGASDGAIEEVNRDQFEAFKTTMDARGALAPSDQSEAQDDDVELESDDDEQDVAEQPTVADLYVTKIRAMIADPETPFPVVGRYWNDTKAERAEMLNSGLMSKETRNELLDELDQRKKAAAAPAPQEDGPSAPPPPSSGPGAPPAPANDEEPITKLDREFRAALEACTDKVAVAALAAETLVARNKYSGTPQHKAWSDLVAAKRKSFAGVSA